MAAAAQGSRVEVTSLEDEFSDTYANADGTFTTETSSTPLRVPAAGGGWSDVDYDLQHVDGGWSPKVSPVPVVFSDGGDKDAVALGDGSKEVDLSWAVTLPTPTVSGATATYDLGGGQSLVLTATSTGFEQSLVLASAPTSVPQIKLPFDTSDLTMSADGAGGFSFTNTSGSTVYSMPAPVMYPAEDDPSQGMTPDAKVVSANLVQTADGARLDLTPSMSWLQDPSTQYPVTIDPSINITHNGDTYVQSNVTTSQLSSVTVHAGKYGGYAARTYEEFDTSALAGKHVTQATLSLYNTNSNTCTPATMHVYPLTQRPTIGTVTWANKATYSTASPYNNLSASFANGNEGASPPCANASVSINVLPIVQAWVKGSANGGIDNDGFQLSGAETTGAQGWAFCSQNVDTTNGTACTTSARVPTLSVTYNSIPGTASGQQIAPSVAGSNPLLTNSATPQLSAVVPDADGGPMTYKYEVSTSAASANDVATGSATGTAGVRATWTVPSGKLADGSSYYWRVYGNDGTDSGAASGWQKFSVDTTAPPAPAVTSTDWPSGSWNSTTTSTISWSSTASDTSTFQYQLDNQADWTTIAAGSKQFTLGSNEQHTIKVEALDVAGNVSPATTYTFGIGNGALTSPSEGQSSAKTFLLSAAAQSATPWVSYQWRLGATGSFAAVPAGDVAQYGTGSAAPSTWPWVSASTSNYVWNAAHTVTGDGDLQLEVCFASDSSGTGSSCQSDPTDVQLSSGSFSAASATSDIGPGNVSLVTGDFSVSASDANIAAFNSSLSLSRSIDSLHPAAANTTANGVFGPGWVASLDGPDGGAAGETVAKAGDNSYVTLTSADGSEDTYKATTSLSANPVKYTGLGDAADGSSLTYSSSTQTGPDPVRWTPGYAA